MIKCEILPGTLKGPRLYVTDFDPFRLRALLDFDRWSIDVARRLKVFLITNRFLVIGASHLNSLPAYKFFSSNSYLLESGMVIPALRSDVKDIAHYIKIEEPFCSEACQFYRSLVKSSIRWEYKATSTNFQYAIISALREKDSLLNRNLSYQSTSIANAIIARIWDSEFLSRQELNSILFRMNLPHEDIGIFQRFCNLLYDLTGARAVNCETALQKLDHMDFSLKDFSQNKTNLSESLVVWKLLVDLVFNSLSRPLILPLEALDLLTFEEIKEIQEPLQAIGFCSQYDELISASLRKLHLKDDSISLESVESLLNLRELVERSFKEALSRQKELFLSKAGKSNKKKILKSSFSFGVALAGFIPGLAHASHMFDVGEKGRELITRVTETYSPASISKHTAKAVKEVILRSNISEKTALYDAIRLLNDIISDRYRLI